MAKAIQRVELNAYYWVPVHCPFCGVRVMGADPVDETRMTPCTHTLFIAHDDGFEFRDERFDENLGIQGIAGEVVDGRAEGIDAFTDKVSLPDAIKVAAYASAQSGFGSYYGFAPLHQV